MINTIGTLKELLSLAKEIAQTEHLDERAALKRALAKLPRLTNDAQANVRYQPKTRPVTRWRPVER